MELRTGIPLRYKDKFYVVSDDIPQNGDWVLTENYGVWEFKDETGGGSAPLPYWANKKTCKKIVATTDKSLGLPLINSKFKSI
jgi:hypothetical protein